MWGSKGQLSKVTSTLAERGLGMDIRKQLNVQMKMKSDARAKVKCNAAASANGLCHGHQEVIVAIM
jgi:hypothetical protein